MAWVSEKHCKQERVESKVKVESDIRNWNLIQLSVVCIEKGIYSMYTIEILAQQTI